MGRGIRRQGPAMVVACIALIAALGGTVYAAQKIDGKTIKAKSLPGNRLVPGSLPADRLRPGTIGPEQLAPGSITGAQVDASTLGPVPSAVHADSATSARDAQTALNAVNALDATRVNGHSAGCPTQTRPFAGACWQSAHSEEAVPAPVAARACAIQGGELPGALALAAFTQEAGVALASGNEWTEDVSEISGPGGYAVATVSPLAVISSALSNEARKYRCVLPLVR